jgi:hypothetical protein
LRFDTYLEPQLADIRDGQQPPSIYFVEPDAWGALATTFISIKSKLYRLKALFLLASPWPITQARGSQVANPGPSVDSPYQAGRGRLKVMQRTMRKPLRHV